MTVRTQTLVDKRSKKRIKVKMLHVRYAIQSAFVAFAFYIGLQHYIVGGGPSGAPSLCAFCPFGAVETFWSWITTGAFLRTTNTANLVIMVAVLATALLMGRAFCGWMCPLGAVQEWIARLGSRLTGGNAKKRKKGMIPVDLPPVVDKPLRYLKYLVLATIFWSSLEAVFPPLREFCPYRILPSAARVLPLSHSLRLPPGDAAGDQRAGGFPGRLTVGGALLVQVSLPVGRLAQHNKQDRAHQGGYRQGDLHGVRSLRRLLSHGHRGTRPEHHVAGVHPLSGLRGHLRSPRRGEPAGGLQSRSIRTATRFQVQRTLIVECVALYGFTIPSSYLHRICTMTCYDGGRKRGSPGDDQG
jgi:hypothetical protein